MKLCAGGNDGDWCSEAAQGTIFSSYDDKHVLIGKLVVYLCKKCPSHDIHSKKTQIGSDIVKSDDAMKSRVVQNCL